MKALSIRQPWASLIVSGVKNIENRSWGTQYRGPLAICASAVKPAARDIQSAREICAANGWPFPGALPTGGILGVVDLVGFVQSQGGEMVSDNPGALPDTIVLDWYQDGAVGWVLVNPRPIQFLRFKGRLGLFDVSDGLIKIA